MGPCPTGISHTVYVAELLHGKVMTYVIFPDLTVWECTMYDLFFKATE